MIELRDVQKILDRTHLIDIDLLEVESGEVAVLLGQVGSGQDMLFRLLIGEQRPSAGSIRLAGIDPFRERSAMSRLVGVMFANNNLYFRMPALDNLQFFSRLLRLPMKRAVDVLNEIGMADHAHSSLEELPAGMLRRLALGRALLHRPAVLILFEPFRGCEPASTALIARTVRSAAHAGAAVLMMVREDAHLELCGDVVHTLEQGKLTGSYDPRAQQRHRPFLIPARGEDRVILVDPADILFVYAQDDRSFLQTLQGSYPTQFTLTELEERLKRSGFFRAHRAYLVNLQQIREVFPYTRDSFILRLKDPAATEIPLSKTAQRELRALLGY